MPIKRMPETNGPGFLFVLAALVVVAVIGAKLLGFAPGGKQGAQPPPAQGQEQSAPKNVPRAVGGNEPVVLVYHTYATENYQPSPDHTKGGPGDIVDVGTALIAALDARGVSALHDTGIGDYPTYAEAEANARARIKAILAKHTGIQVLLDVRRDAMPPDKAPTPGAMETLADGQPTARILFVVGNVDNPHAAANVAFATKLKEALDRLHPGLARGVLVQPRALNDDLTEQALQVYVGGYRESTVADAERAVDALADALAEVLGK